MSSCGCHARILQARTLARFTVATLPVGFLLIGEHPEVAISPDGTRIVYGSSNPVPLQRLLYLRHVNQIEVAPIRGTEGGSYPVFSPDGDSIAFFDEANASLKRVAGPRRSSSERYSIQRTFDGDDLGVR